MSSNARAARTKVAGPWREAVRRLRGDGVATGSLVVVLLFVLLVLASGAGLVAKDWNTERGVSYAKPSILRGFAATDGMPAVAATPDVLPGSRDSISVDDVDPLAADYTQIETKAASYLRSEPPRLKYLPFGADKWGRDVLLKTIKGAETSVLVGFASALVAVLLGTLFGALAGYFRGWVNDLFEWIYNVFTSIPNILLILALVAVLQRRGLSTIVLILGMTGWTSVYRLMRAEYLRQAEREYVRAAAAMGASHWRRIFVHILPNASHVILVNLSLLSVGFIKAEVILSYLGFGVPVGMTSWGTMLAEAQSELVAGIWWQFVAAAFISMALLITAFSLFTDSLRDALDPKLR